MLVKCVLDGLHGRDRSRFSTNAYNKKAWVTQKCERQNRIFYCYDAIHRKHRDSRFFAFVVTCVLWSLENRIL